MWSFLFLLVCSMIFHFLHWPTFVVFPNKVNSSVFGWNVSAVGHCVASDHCQYSSFVTPSNRNINKASEKHKSVSMNMNFRESSSTVWMRSYSWLLFPVEANLHIASVKSVFQRHSAAPMLVTKRKRITIRLFSCLLDNKTSNEDWRRATSNHCRHIQEDCHPFIFPPTPPTTI